MGRTEAVSASDSGIAWTRSSSCRNPASLSRAEASAAARRGRDARLEPCAYIFVERDDPPGAASTCRLPGGEPRFAPQQRGDEALRHHPDDPHGCAVQHDLAPDRVARAAEGDPPKAVAQEDDRLAPIERPR